MLVGAGGAGRALAVGAKSREARVVIFDIDFGILTLALQYRMMKKYLNIYY